MNRLMRLAAACAAAVVLLTACKTEYPPGPAGKVTDRSRAYYKSGGWRYWLTVGDTKFRVTHDEYENCFRGSSYRACAKRTDGG